MIVAAKTRVPVMALKVQTREARQMVVTKIRETRIMAASLTRAGDKILKASLEAVMALKAARDTAHQVAGVIASRKILEVKIPAARDMAQV